MRTEVEKQELELFREGQFVIEDEEKEDATAPAAANPPEEKKVIGFFCFTSQACDISTLVIFSSTYHNLFLY